MNTWCITGSSGFVGKHLMQYLKDKGEVAIGVPRNIFNDYMRLERFMYDVKPDVIVNLAAYGNHYNQKDPVQALEVNYTGTYNLLEVTRKLPYKAFIHISTSSVTLPHQTFYSATKMGSEYLCKAFASEYKKPVVSLRPYSLYGEGEADFRFIPTVFRSCLEGEEMILAPEPVHDWTYVGDFVERIYLLANYSSELDGRVIGVGTGVERSNLDVVRLIEKITNNKANITKKKSLRKFDTDSWRADILDSLTPTTLKQGLKRYYEWYLAKGGEQIHGSVN